MKKQEKSKSIFDTYLEQAEKTPFAGWNFEYITRTRRMTESPLDWNYHNMVLPYMIEAETMLDMETGGGETLANFAPLPSHTFATEQYAPNVSIAREKLEPLGVKVVEVDGQKYPDNESLPFDSGYFDLVINRHEAYNVEELSRIIKNDGIFVSQQVGSENLRNLVCLLKGRNEEAPDWNLGKAVAELESAGFHVIIRQENIKYYRFYDIGAIVYLLKAIPWIIDGFIIYKYIDRLWKLHVDICDNGFYDALMHRFIIVTQKSASVYSIP